MSTNYQKLVLQNSKFYSHWTYKNKNNNQTKSFDPIYTDIDQDKLLSTITFHQNTNSYFYHTNHLSILFIMLRVETEEYIILTTNKNSDIGSGYSNFLQLPLIDINDLENHPIQLINLPIKPKDLVSLQLPSNFLDSIIKSSPYKWNWINQPKHSTKKSDYQQNLIGWWTNPSLTSQYCQFYQITKNISFSQFYQIIQEIETKNQTTTEKLVIVKRNDLLCYSPDLRTIAALYLSNPNNQSNNFHPTYLNRIDICYSIVFSFFITFLILLTQYLLL